MSFSRRFTVFDILLAEHAGRALQVEQSEVQTRQREQNDDGDEKNQGQRIPPPACIRERAPDSFSAFATNRNAQRGFRWIDVTFAVMQPVAPENRTHEGCGGE